MEIGQRPLTTRFFRMPEAQGQSAVTLSEPKPGMRPPANEFGVHARGKSQTTTGDAQGWAGIPTTMLSRQGGISKMECFSL